MTDPIVVMLDQRTAEWKEWRRRGVTATEAARISSAGPQALKTLWEEKLGLKTPPDISHLPSVRNGILNEEKALRLWELEHGDVAFPVLVERADERFMRASLDGLSSGGFPVELKNPQPHVFEEACSLGESSYFYRHYYAQVQYQIWCCDRPYGWLYAHCNGKTKSFKVMRDDAFLSELLPKVRSFWTNVSFAIDPTAVSTASYSPATPEEVSLWEKETREIREATEAVKALEKQIAEQKARKDRSVKVLLEQMGEAQSGQFNGVTIQLTLRRGSIDWKRFVTANGLKISDAENYRNAASKTVNVNVSDPD